MRSRSALIVRSQLNPYEEAKAVAAMLERGYTQDGAAQALGWAKARVTARVKLLELPEAAQVMVGDGRIALAAIDHLLAVGKVSAPLLDALISYMGQAGDEWTNSRIVREPAWVIGQALRAGELNGSVFAEFLGQVSSYELRELALGKTAEALIEQASELHKKLDRYSYGFTVEFSEQEVDQARAAGVLIEFDTDRSAPIICRPQAVSAAVPRRAEAHRLRAPTADHAARGRPQSRAGRPASTRPRSRPTRSLTPSATGAGGWLKSPRTPTAPTSTSGASCLTACPRSTRPT